MKAARARRRHVLRSWSRAGLSWPELARRTARQLIDGDVLGRAAQLAYFFLFSVFPLLLFLTTLLGYLVAESDAVRQELFSYLREVVPDPAAYQLLRTTLEEIQVARGGGKLALGLLLALWLASRGMAALILSLNAAYKVPEARPYWQRQLLALALTVGFAVLVIISIVLVFYGDALAATLAERYALGGGFTALWQLFTWLLILAALIPGFDLLYNLAPNVERCDRRWLTPGAVVAVAVWLLGSLGFRLYLQLAADYSKTYGSLGAVIVLLTWFYLTGNALLIGGTLNSEICEAERSRRGDLKSA